MERSLVKNLQHSSERHGSRSLPHLGKSSVRCTRVHSAKESSLCEAINYVSPHLGTLYLSREAIPVKLVVHVSQSTRSLRWLA